MLGFLFSFRGRASRADIWKFSIACTVLVLGLKLIFKTSKSTNLSTLFREILSHPLVADRFFWIFFLLTICIALLAGLAVTTRRLHDREKSAWWLIPFWGLPQLPGLLFPGGFSVHTAYGWLGGLLTLISLGFGFWAFLELFCFTGSIGENAYGRDPLPRPVINPFLGEQVQ